MAAGFEHRDPPLTEFAGQPIGDGAGRRIVFFVQPAQHTFPAGKDSGRFFLVGPFWVGRPGPGQRVLGDDP